MTHHAAQRAWQRYGIQLSQDDCSDIARCIRDGLSVLERRQDRFDDREIHYIRYANMTMRVVYAPANDAIVTLLDLHHAPQPTHKHHAAAKHAKPRKRRREQNRMRRAIQEGETP